MPLVASGPAGDAYRVKCMEKYLVVRKGVFHPEKPEEDAIATTEVWTNELAIARHLVDPERNKRPVCRCAKCWVTKKVRTKF